MNNKPSIARVMRKISGSHGKPQAVWSAPTGKINAPILGKANTFDNMIKNGRALVLVLLIALPGLLVSLNRRSGIREMPSRAVLSSQETWIRQHGYLGSPRESLAWLLPTQRGKPRINKPPMIVWLNLIAWSGLTPQNSTVAMRIYRARLVSVCLALIMLGAVFWAGLSLGDRKTAVMASLAVATMWFFQRQGRAASYDIQMACWAGLSVAAGLWADNPFRNKPGLWRRIAGWGLCGIALGCSWLTKGPIALAVVVLPLAVMMAFVSGRRLARTIGLICALALAAAVALPWYIYLYIHAAGVLPELMVEYHAKRQEFQVPWYYVGLLALIVPWTLWLVAGLFQPFLDATGPRRKQLLVAWLWFVVIFVFFSIPGAKQQRYILPVLPATGLLIGQVWRQHDEQAKNGIYDPGTKWLWIPHWVGLIGVALFMAPFLLSQQWMLEQGWLKELPIGPISVSLALGLSFVLLIIALAGAWWHYQCKPFCAFGATVCWMVLLMCVVWFSYCRSSDRQAPEKQPAERIAGVAGHHPLFFITDPPDVKLLRLQFLLYCQHVVRFVPQDEINSLNAVQNDLVYGITWDKQQLIKQLSATGWQMVLRFDTRPGTKAILWRHAASQ